MKRLISAPAATAGGYSISVEDVQGRPANVPITDAGLLDRIFDAAALLKPDRIVFVQGTPEEDRVLKLQMQSDGTLIALDPAVHPNSFLHRSRPTDTARVTDRTFVASKDKTAAGPLVNWKNAAEMREILNPILDGAMRGKTMYVLCGILGPDASPHSKLAIQITDSPYVVANVTALYGVGKAAFDRLNRGESYSFGVHASANLDREKLFVARFTETDEVVSVNSAYGGNAILFKKAIGLGTASARARREGWMAEHMALIELENPAGERMGIAVCKPSASGKTNDAMLNAEITALGKQGWKVRTISDDIVYMHVDNEGYLRAIPIERGFFGVAPGTSEKTNPHVMATLRKGDALYTNVAVDRFGEVWWEGLGNPPERFTDWKGREWYQLAEGTNLWRINGNGGTATAAWQNGSWLVIGGEEYLDPNEASTKKVTAAHPNSRYTARAAYCPSISPRWMDSEGIRVGAIVFEGRRADTVPLVYEARDWGHGVFIGATLGAETTAAIEGQVGKIRRDPMANGDFVTYRPGDYFEHWLGIGERLVHPPRIFHKNSFRKDDSGHFVWPGFAENLRVYEWVFRRVSGVVEAVETPIGFMPRPEDINLEGVEVTDADRRLLLDVDLDAWEKEVDAMEEFLTTSIRRDGGPGAPIALLLQLDRLRASIAEAKSHGS